MEDIVPKCSLEGSVEKMGKISKSEGVKEEAKPNVGDNEAAQATIKPTVIRIKRRIEDSPSKILVVSCKRSKTEGGFISPASPTTSLDNNDSSTSDSSSFSKILRLVGTVPEEEADNNNISITVRNIIGASGPTAGASSQSSEVRDNLRKNIKAKKTKITEKARERVKKSTEENRFKMVASRRGLSDDKEGDEYDKDLLKLLDLVPESDVKEQRNKEKPEGFETGNVTCNGKPMVKEVNHVEKGYVYDLYLSNDPCIEEFMCGQFVSVEEGVDDLDFGEFRENQDEQVEDFVEDDDDSNDEDNWRNDYPDSEEEGLRNDVFCGAQDNSDNELFTTFKSMSLRKDSSSDDDLVYGIDDDFGDCMGFDKRYSQYKRRVMREYEDEVVSVSSESDYD